MPESEELLTIHRSIAGNADTQSNAEAVTVSGNYAYVTDWNSRLQIIDVSNPANPTIVGTVGTPGDALDVTISGNYVYVADSYSGLTVYRAIPNE